MDVPIFLFNKKEIKKLKKYGFLNNVKKREIDKQVDHYFQIPDKDFSSFLEKYITGGSILEKRISEAASNKTMVVRLVSVAFNLASRATSVEARLTLVSIVSSLMVSAPTEARRLLAYVR